MYATTYKQYVIMLDEMDTFSVWLQQEMDSRGWNQADLHRKADLSRTVISDVLTGKVKPGFEFCVKVGKAFHIPGELVMQKAELLPKTSSKNEEHLELQGLYEALNAQDRETVLNMMRFLLSKK